MAVIDQFTVTIRVQGQACLEYEDEDLNTTASESTVPTISRYIEARPGQKFVVHLGLEEGYTFPAGTNSLAWGICLDGKCLYNLLMKQEDYVAHRCLHMKSEGKVSNCDNQWTTYPYIFSELHISQDSIQRDAQTVKDKYGSLGTIQVQIKQYYQQGLTTALLLGEQGSDNAKSVPEKALKGRAITLGAGLDAAVPCRPINTYSGYVVDPQPLAKFEFHYRSKKSLQDLMVIPREDNIEHMTAEELRSLLRQQTERANANKAETKPVVKRERKTYEADSEDDEILEIREVKRSKKVASEVIEIDSD